MSKLKVAIAVGITSLCLYIFHKSGGDIKMIPVYGIDGTMYIIPKVFRFGAKCCIGGVKMITVIGRNGAEYLIPRNFTFTK